MTKIEKIVLTIAITFVLSLIGFLIHDILTCVDTTYYQLEINNGEDKYMGEDYEKAKEMAQGRLIYPQTYCK